MSSPKDKQELVFNPVSGELDTVLKFNPDRILTHDKNAAGNPIVTFDPVSNSYMTLEGQVVIDGQGNVVTT